MTQPIWHVCSLVVQCVPEQLAAVTERISEIPEAEVFATNEEGCKLVVLMESDDADLLYQKMQSIQEDIPGVLAVSLVYHQQDEEAEVTP
ncbi:chaperone NapD [Saezia sanguinis]|jgi:nitrate reductase NapD|uniref:chaperone NapD n=1 Tax=Saezia sanguinis TaxID=1965230 RepID=UPI0030281B91